MAKKPAKIKPEVMSFTAAARRLGVSWVTMKVLAAKHGLPTWRVPGHSRQWLLVEGVESLAERAGQSED